MLILIIIFFTFFTINAEFLSLPLSVKDKAVNYVKTCQINDWSCGYNALFNACNLESFFGKSNIYSDYKNFNTVCLRHTNKFRKNPKDAMSNVEIEELATKLNLNKLTYLHFNDQNQIAPLISGMTSIAYESGTPEYKIKLMLEQAVKEKEFKAIESLKKILDTQTSLILHFICHVHTKNRDHAILITLVQKYGKNRVLYIFDNTNEDINENSEVKDYIDYLCNHFSISENKQLSTLWTNLKIPTHWPTTPKDFISNKVIYLLS